MCKWFKYFLLLALASPCLGTTYTSSRGLMFDSATGALITTVSPILPVIVNSYGFTVDSTGALVVTVSGGASGTVTTSGSPANGNLTKFSGASAITNGDLSGDVTTSGTLATTIATGAVTDDKASLLVKPAATVVANANTALSGLLTIDGVTVADGAIVLATAQTSGSQNGPWVAHSGAWTRPTWYSAGSTTQAPQFLTISVRLGTAFQGSHWRMTTAAVTVDTTVTAWVQTPMTFSSNSVNAFTSSTLAGILSDETGSGAAVFGTSPTLVTPILGTPTSGTLTNATGLPISTGVSGLATGVATFLGTPSSANLAAATTDETGSGALVFATSPTFVTPILGTPTSGTLTNATGLPISTGVSGLGTGVATFLGTPSSANLASAITDETGSGAAVFGTSPTIVTPTIASFTNATHNHTNAAGGGQLDLTAAVTGVLPPANGGVSALTTSTVGYWCSPTVACIGAASTTTAANTNQVRVIKFNLPFRTTIRTVQTEVTTAQAGKFYAVGIYNAACTSLLVDSGPLTAASVAKVSTTVVGGAVTLDPGAYSFAFTTDASTAVVRGQTLDATVYTLVNNTTTQMGNAANASVAGQLPATCGALSATTFAGQLAVWAP